VASYRRVISRRATLSRFLGLFSFCDEHIISASGYVKWEAANVATGTVKWFNPTKGYGFIQPSGGGGRDVFVHISAVERAGLSTLNEGATVEYEITSNRGKESAESLKVK
jgi:CspA family cold shock protein